MTLPGILTRPVEILVQGSENRVFIEVDFSPATGIERAFGLQPFSQQCVRLMNSFFKPKRDLEVLDVNDGLLIRVRQKSSTAGSALSGLVTLGFVLIAFGRYWRPALVITAALLAGTVSFLLYLREKTVELRVSKFEFQVHGKIGSDLQSSRAISCADIRWLEYAEDRSGEGSERPEGLYAVLKYHSVCVLPYVDLQQANALIDRIENRFPNLASQWKSNSPFGEHFTSLGLNNR